MDGGVRVLRIMEYVYEDVERAEADMARWTTTAPPTAHMRFRSSHLPMQAVDWHPPALQGEPLEDALFMTAPQAFAKGISDRSDGVGYGFCPFVAQHLVDSWVAGWNVDHDAEVRSLEARG